MNGLIWARSAVIDDGLTVHTAQGPAGALQETAQALRTYFTSSTPGSVTILTPGAAKRLQVAPLEHGWKGVTDQDGHRRVLGTLSTMDRRTAGLIVLPPTGATAEDYRATAWALDRIRDVIGIPWEGSGMITGVALLKALAPATRGKAQYRWTWRLRTLPPGARLRDVSEGAYTTRWRPADGVPEGPTVQLDMNRAYLAAAGAVQLSRGSLTHTGPVEFDPAMAGWWLVDVPDMDTGRLPHPVPTGPGLRWITTPTAKLLLDLHGRIDVRDAHIGHGARLLRPWAERLNRAWYQTAPAAGIGPYQTAVPSAVKAVYRQTVGLMARERSALYRPDWHYAIIAQSRTTLWRALHRAGEQDGRWPVALQTDAVTYAGDAPPASYRIGDALGTYRIPVPRLEEDGAE